MDTSTETTGLEGVVAATTRLSDVDGEAGALTLAGFAAEALAPKRRFEEVTYLLWYDKLPNESELADFDAALKAGRALSPQTLSLLAQAAQAGATPMAILRLGVAHLATANLQPTTLLGALPSLAAAAARASDGQAPIAPLPPLSQAATFLHQLSGQVPTPEQIRALDTYFNTVIDHGLNASTFTARIIASTGSDLGAALEGALGALQGPLHGGAPGPALEAFFQVREQPGDLYENTVRWVAGEVSAGRRIMGFGHRVYRVRDPRADILARAAQTLLAGDTLLTQAQEHERAVLDTLARLKKSRRLATNVEFYTALLLHGLGLAPRHFTLAFAVARAAGWIAHFQEQQATGRLLRPSSRYIGARDRVA